MYSRYWKYAELRFKCLKHAHCSPYASSEYAYWIEHYEKLCRLIDRMDGYNGN